MTQEVKKQQIKDLQECVGVLQELGVEPFLWAGSLLGAIREKGIIDTDTDVDIAYVSKYHTASEIIEETKSLYEKLRERGLLHDFMDEDHQVKNGEITSVFGQAHIGQTYPYVDLFTMWTVGEDFYDTWFGPVAKGVDTTVVRDAVELEGVMFPSLINPEWVLEMLYGDWKTPREDKGGNRNVFRQTLKQLRLGVV